MKTNYTDFTILSPTGTHYLYSIGGGQVTRSNDFSSHKDPGSHSESGQKPTIGGEHQTKSSHIPQEPYQVSGPPRGRGNHQPLRSAIHLPAITMDVEARWPSHPLTRQVEPTLNTPPTTLWAQSFHFKNQLDIKFKRITTNNSTKNWIYMNLVFKGSRTKLGGWN